MKSTERLSVMGDLSLGRDRILIHPNDGYDLGLLARETPVLIYACESREEFLSGAARSVPGTLVLANSCAHSTIVMNLAWWHELGKPRSVTLGYEGEKLLITRA